MTVKDGDNKASKACKRCVVRKRKCDGSQPQCSNCSAAAAECFYASNVRKRGPVAGFAKAAERRAAVCEDALIFVLGLPGVREALEKAQTQEIDTVTIRPESSAELSEYWECHPLSSALDIEQFRTACLAAESSKAYTRPLGRQSDNSIGVETSYIRQERDLQDLQDLQTYQGALDHFAVPLVSPATATRPPSRSGGTAHLSMFQLPPSSSSSQVTQMQGIDRTLIPPDPQQHHSKLLPEVTGQDDDLFW